jgi:serine/threonine-protein kinase
MALQSLMASVDRPLNDALRERARAVGRRHFGPGGLGDLLPDGSVLGSYVLERVLGEGGQAVVYLGRHRRLPGRLAAVKVPHGAETRRMLQEADVMARLDHPGILGIVDADADADPPYLVLEYCVGGSLSERVETQGPLPVGEVARIARGVADALSCAHALGIVHRDLKPENVLFDSQGNPRIADFGLGKVVAERISLSLSQGSHTGVAGTPVYMAPEQEWPGGKVDGRTDLFALGKLIWFMLTGETPRTLRPVERERPDVDPAWSELIFKLTATAPEDRYSDAAAVVAELDRLTAPPAPELPAPMAASLPAPVHAAPRTGGSRLARVLGGLAYTTAFFLCMAGTLAMVNHAGQEGVSVFIVAGFMFAAAGILRRVANPEPEGLLIERGD